MAGSIAGALFHVSVLALPLVCHSVSTQCREGKWVVSTAADCGCVVSCVCLSREESASQVCLFSYTVFGIVQFVLWTVQGLPGYRRWSALVSKQWGAVNVPVKEA